MAIGREVAISYTISRDVAPLPRPGQPEAAVPDSCIRAASAPGERSFIHGKPMAENGQSYFRGILRCGARAPGDSARIPVGGCGLSVRRGCRCEGFGVRDTAVRCRTS